MDRPTIARIELRVVHRSAVEQALDEPTRSILPLPAHRLHGGSVAVGYTVAVQGQEMILWIHRETEQPRQVNIVFKKEGEPVHAMHFREIRINPSLDPSLFDVAIPEDYSVIQPSKGEAGIRTPIPGN